MKNKYTITDSIATIEVAHKNVDPSLVLISVEDLAKVQRYDRVFIVKGYANVMTSSGKCRALSRVLTNARSKKVVVDHIDGDKLNIIQSNIRKVTKRQDAKNITKTFDRKNNKTGYKGVCYRPKEGKYHATISSNGAWKYLGSYNTALEAAKAYDEGARAYHGEFAYLNFPRRDLV